MSYKTILVHVDQSRHAAMRIKVAANIAIAEGAHLIGAALSGISNLIYQGNTVDLGGSIVAGRIDALLADAKQALAQFNAIAKAEGVASYESRAVNDDPQGGLSLQARYADLVVLSQTDMEEPVSRIIPDLPEYVTLNCARPVLILPYAGQFDRVGDNALIAWDGSMEATRAISNAIPLLRRAKNVTVALFNPSTQYGVHGEQPGADIALFLVRHGIKVEVKPQHCAIDVGNALLSLAADLHADLLVMGCYGHTRFRELLLGGVTHTLLKTMTVPVLMSH
ncbi:MAG TPA: universal stress protein [Janthinobacterium sp.]|nr:universal stress protein [Janthinobacterium sp.]